MNTYHSLSRSRLNLLRNLSACLLLTSLLMSFSGAALASAPSAAVSGNDTAPQTLRVAVYDSPPSMIINPDGEVDGFAVELLRAVLKSVGQDVIFEPGTFAEATQKLRDGAVQVVPRLTRTPEREELFAFTISYLSSPGALVVRRDETGIHRLADLAGKQVAVRHNGVAEKILKNSDLNVSIAETPTNIEALRQLAKGQHDAVIMDQLLAHHLKTKSELKNLKLVGLPLNSFVHDYGFAINKDNTKLLAQLNEGLADVITDGTHDALSTKWHLRAGAKEGESGRRIVVGGDASNYPYEFLDANGQPAGYTVDLVRAVAKQAGLEIDIRLGPWAEIRKSLARQDIDAIVGMFYSPERDRTFDFSPAHSLANYMIVSREEKELAPQTLADLAGKTVVVMDGDMMHDFALQQGFAMQLTLAKSFESAVSAVASGENDYALVPKVAALMAIDKHDWTHLRTSKQSILTSDYCFAVPHGRQELLNQLTEGLLAVKATGEYRQIYSKWLGVYEKPKLELWDVIKYSLYIVVPLLVLLLATLLWSRTLRRSVHKATEQLYCEIAEHKQTHAELDEKNQELDNKNRELDNKNTEMERFTYMVSHDLKSPVVTVKNFLGLLREDLAAGDTKRIDEDFGYIDAAADTMSQLLADLLEYIKIGQTAGKIACASFQSVVQGALSRVAGSLLDSGITLEVDEVDIVLSGDVARLTQLWQNLLENAIKFTTDHPNPHIVVGLEEIAGETVFFVRDNGIGIDARYHQKVFGLFEQLDVRRPGTGFGLAFVKKTVEQYQGRVWLESAGQGHGTCFHFTLPDVCRAREENSLEQAS